MQRGPVSSGAPRTVVATCGEATKSAAIMTRPVHAANSSAKLLIRSTRAILVVHVYADKRALTRNHNACQILPRNPSIPGSVQERRLVLFQN